MSSERVILGHYESFWRIRCEADLTTECTRTSCLEPEVHELAEFALALLDLLPAAPSPSSEQPA